MAAVLADTSVWVDYLRRGEAGRAKALSGLLHRGQLLTCGPIAAELVAGTNEAQRDEVWHRLRALRWVDLDAETWHRAGLAYGALRSRGRLVPLLDCAIALAAVTAGASLWTLDEDFSRVEEVVPELRRYAPE